MSRTMTERRKRIAPIIRRLILCTLSTVIIGALTLELSGCGWDITTVFPKPAASRFEDPTTCGACHPTHFKEWQGSIMHYAAVSPVFNAFELTVRKLTDGALPLHECDQLSSLARLLIEVSGQLPGYR